MPRTKIYVERSSGSTVIIKEHTTHDLIPILYIRNNVSKEALALYKNPEQVGRKYEKVAQIVGARIFRHFLFLLVNHLMDSDRVVLQGGESIFIGLHKKNSERVASYRKKRQIYFANNGRRYGIILYGLDHKYYFRMPHRRRLELRDRINKGQRFYNPSD